MEKPTPEVLLVVQSSMREGGQFGKGHIRFFASEEVANSLREYGEVALFNGSTLWQLSIDPRWNFDKVLAYVQDYDKNHS